MNMTPEEARALLPQRPTPESWFAFVALGLIGSYLTVATINTAYPDIGLAVGLGSAFSAGFAFTGAWLDASRLDEAEGDL